MIICFGNWISLCIYKPKYILEKHSHSIRAVTLWIEANTPLSKTFTSKNNFLAVYDVTIAYKNQCPSFLDNVFGVDPSEVHMHIRRIPLEEIPLSETKASTWLMDEFVLKDQLLTDFIVNGHFPQQETEGQLSMVKCVANCTIVVALTGIFIFLTFFSSNWFKVYVGLVCVYAACATYFSTERNRVVQSEDTIHQKKTCWMMDLLFRQICVTV